MKITFGKSEPWSSGWRGWSDHIDVVVDGVKIGELAADGEPQKRYLSYSWSTQHPAGKLYPSAGIYGLRAAKARVVQLLTPDPIQPNQPRK